MHPRQPVSPPNLSALAVAQAADLASAYDGDAAAAARAGLQLAEREDDADAIILWRAVCEIFDGTRNVEM